MSEAPLRARGGAAVPVKVCGLTRVQDARRAWELGAAALGLIFHPASPRFLAPVQARELRRSLPPEAVVVGVFVDRPASEVNAVADFVGLSMVQLHGRESMSLQRAVTRPLIKAVRAEDEPRLARGPASLLLLDASHPVLAGGTGLRADWDLAARLARRHPLLLAGGLGPDNVAEALAAVAPAALDVNSGVEARPGEKDAGRLRALFQALSQTLSTAAVPVSC